jgi:CelD/BcsL family acetyltransferase involved in cellulose biosynthesis
MRTEVYRAGESLDELVDEWLALWDRSPSASPFQHPDWIRSWWPLFGSGELMCVTVRVNADLVAIAPMFLHEWNGRRQVTFVGNGPSDRLGFLGAPEFTAHAVPCILEALAAERDRWDVCDLQDLPPGFEMENVRTRAPVEWTLVPQHTCAKIALPESMTAYDASLPHGLRRNMRRYREKLEQAGGVCFARVPAEQGIECLLALHGQRWRGRGEPGMFAGLLGDFHRRAARALARRCVVRFFALVLDGRPAAIIYGFLSKSRFWSYQSGFDPALARFSPGALVLEYAISEAIREGAREFDFLRGSEEYKRDWGAVFETSCRLVLWHNKRPVDLVGPG